MHTGDSDEALVQAARRGDRDALSRLLERHWQMLLALCRRALGDVLLAEDAAQEAALQAMLCLDRLRRADRFGSWLGGIGLNVCRRWLRERTRESWSWEALHGGWRAVEPSDWHPSPEELAEAADTAERVRRAVAELPPGQRAAVLLYYLSGLTYAEMAAQLGIEVSAVKQRLHKARAALRRRLEAEWKEDEMVAQTPTQPVEVRVADVRRVPADGDRPVQYIVVLEEIGGTRRLPIWIGRAEGDAVAMQLENVQAPRPQTYTFTANVLQATGSRLREVTISKLTDDVFYASAVVEGAGGVMSVDARPSDAINLALVVGAPILVEPAVIEAAERSASAQPRALADPFGEGTSGAKEIVDEIRVRLR